MQVNVNPWKPDSRNKEEEEKEEEEETMIHRNVGIYSHKDTTLRHRRRKSPTVIKPNVTFVFRAIARVITRSVKHM